MKTSPRLYREAFSARCRTCGWRISIGNEEAEGRERPLMLEILSTLLPRALEQARLHADLDHTHIVLYQLSYYGFMVSDGGQGADYKDLEPFPEHLGWFR